MCVCCDCIFMHFVCVCSSVSEDTMSLEPTIDVPEEQKLIPDQNTESREVSGTPEMEESFL